jgi:hypothetical protein
MAYGPDSLVGGYFHWGSTMRQKCNEMEHTSGSQGAYGRDEYHPIVSRPYDETPINLA